MTGTQGSIVKPGRNCWRVARADNMAVIIDAEQYFAVLRQALLMARHDVLLIGWDFDTRVKLFHGDGHGIPTKLGQLLNFVAKRRPNLQIRLLKWDLGALMTLGRGSTPLMILDWISHKNIHFRLDGHHPHTASHHQKIVVIDDVLAFCGGIDITADRWDTRQHLDEDPRRIRPTTRRHYGPWHDATTAVDGACAKALGDLARLRWKAATGETLQPPRPAAPFWPEALQPQFRDVDVGIARTYPAWEGQDEVREIETLYLDAIAGAKRSVYIESQYFASRTIAEAVRTRLGEDDGPEIVVVNPISAAGWLEEEAMGTARAELLRHIRSADRHGRFRIFTPKTAGGDDIYVHAKVLVVDDVLLRVGSSNVNNRSLGFDTECDLVLDATGTPADSPLRTAIRNLRADLLAEHCGQPREAMAAAIDGHGGALIRAVDFCSGPGRRLEPFVAPATNGIERDLAATEWLDPEKVSRAVSSPRSWRRVWRALRPWSGSLSLRT